MPCDEWCRLVERYRAAVSAYNEAAKALGVLPGTAFNETWSRTERARTKCDIRRADLLQHEHHHACLEAGHHNGNGQMSSTNTESMVSGDQGQSGN
jgi:hypothetical protein